MSELEVPHSWFYCSHCDYAAVTCGKCGNNTCNGGYGTLKDGTTCDACPSAYEMFKEGKQK